MDRPTLRALGLSALLALACSPKGLYDDPSRTFADASMRTTPGRTVVHIPASLSGIQGTVTAPSGQPVEIRCGTCHGVLSPPPALPASPDALHGPHTGLRFEHGSAQCASCHDPAHFDRLHLATGESLPMTEALRLCAQCHGPQFRDFTRGSHGGMTGYWDLRRGDRVRNHCVDCHDPHAPRFPRFMPMPPPRDAVRSLENHHG